MLELIDKEDAGCYSRTYIKKRTYTHVKMIVINKELPESFWNNVDIKEKDKCWILKGYSYTNKYNQTYGLTTFNGKSTFTNRISWILTYGDIPKGMFVCHKCDSPICVNPNHLFLGTQKDNIRDCVKKGRHGNSAIIIMSEDVINYIEINKNPKL